MRRCITMARYNIFNSLPCRSKRAVSSKTIITHMARHRQQLSPSNYWHFPCQHCCKMVLINLSICLINLIPNAKAYIDGDSKQRYKMGIFILNRLKRNFWCVTCFFSQFFKFLTGQCHSTVCKYTILFISIQFCSRLIQHEKIAYKNFS